MGVEVHDRNRVWFLVSNNGHPMMPEKEEWTKEVDMEVVDKLLGERYNAKRERNFRVSDQIQDELRDMSIEIDDNNLSWRLMGANWD